MILYSKCMNACMLACIIRMSVYIKMLVKYICIDEVFSTCPILKYYFY